MEKKTKRIVRCRCGCGEYANPGNRFINGHCGRVESEETKKKRSQSLRLWSRTTCHSSLVSSNNKKSWKIKEYRDNQIKRLSVLHKGKTISSRTKALWSLQRSGEGNPNWRGGSSCEPYCDAWSDREYKADIKERDGHKCQNPLCWGKSAKLCIHHIDYDKKNCRPENLITLCISCNSRANYNRNKWKKYYMEINSGK